MYLRISSRFTHGSRKTSPQVCFDRSPNSKRKILFFFFPLSKAPLSFKLSPVSLPAMDLTYPLTSDTYPRGTGFILVKLSPLLSWEQMVSMTCHALFSWMGMWYPRCMARSPNPDVHLTSNRVTVTSAGMTWGDTAAKFFLTFQGAQKYLSLVVITIVQSFHGMDEKKKRLREFYFFFSHSANIYWAPAMCLIVLIAGDFIFFNFIFHWRIITLQYCVGFCHTSKWISHRYTYAPSLWNLFPISHPITPL